MPIMSLSRVAFTTKTGTLTVIGLASTVLGWLTVWYVQQSISGGGLSPVPLFIVLPIVFLIFFLPNWMLLILGIPLLMMLSNIFSIPHLLSVGEARIHAYDLIIPVLALKVLSFAAVHRQRIEIHPSITTFLM